MTDIQAAISAAASGMRAQTVRMRVAAENVANANSTGASPDEEPFRRRIPLLESTTLSIRRARRARERRGLRHDARSAKNITPAIRRRMQMAMCVCPMSTRWWR